MSTQNTPVTKQPLVKNAAVTSIKLKSAALKGKEVVESWQYYIVIETEKGALQINTGEKAYNTIQAMTNEDNK